PTSPPLQHHVIVAQNEIGNRSVFQIRLILLKRQGHLYRFVKLRFGIDMKIVNLEFHPQYLFIVLKRSLAENRLVSTS
ncbi:MAG: hypothetical protein WBI59_06360, partial [Limnochordia bacterium]